jgi:hypothetical protein
LKGKKGCKFPSVEDEEGSVEEVVEEVATPSAKSLVASLKKLLSSPVWVFRKRKEADLSPESQKEKAASTSTAVHARRESPSPELIDMDSQTPMPPPSLISSRSQASTLSRLFFPSEDYRVRLLQTALRKSEEDLNTAQDRFASRESLYLDQIAALEKQVGKGGPSCRK